MTETHGLVARDREAEFGGSTRLLCDSANTAALRNLEFLSLYSNKLTK